MRYIPIDVLDEYVKGDGVNIGAEYSHDDVCLRITFGDMWQGLSKHITWLNANGDEPTIQYITANNLVPGTLNTYDIPIPFEAKRYKGQATMSIYGCIVENHTHTASINSTTWEASTLGGTVGDFTFMYEDWSSRAGYGFGWHVYNAPSGYTHSMPYETLSSFGITIDGETERHDKLIVHRTDTTLTITSEDNYIERKATLTATSYFNILESIYDENAEEAQEIPGSVKDQIQGQIEELIETISEAEGFRDEAEDFRDEAEDFKDQAETEVDKVENLTVSSETTSETTAQVIKSLISGHYNFHFKLPRGLNGDDGTIVSSTEPVGDNYKVWVNPTNSGVPETLSTVAYSGSYNDLTNKPTIPQTIGDMLKSTYDTNNDGKVNDSDKLGGNLPSYYATDSALTLHTSNATSHVTSSDKSNWNGKEDKGKVTIGENTYTLRTGTSGAAGYITIEVEE